MVKKTGKKIVNQSNVWLISDTHFGHSNIIEYCRRPFTNITAHDDALVTAWNAKVQPDDLVFVLGDFIMGDDTHIAHILPRLQGNIILIKGNHDGGRRIEYLAALSPAPSSAAPRGDIKEKAFHLADLVNQAVRGLPLVSDPQYMNLKWGKEGAASQEAPKYCAGFRGIKTVRNTLIFSHKGKTYVLSHYPERAAQAAANLQALLPHWLLFKQVFSKVLFGERICIFGHVHNHMPHRNASGFNVSVDVLPDYSLIQFSSIEFAANGFKQPTLKDKLRALMQRLFLK